MDKNLHHIDQYFKEGIEGHREEPNDTVWAMLDSALDKQVLYDTQRKYRFLKRAVAAVLILSASVALGLWVTYTPPKTEGEFSKPTNDQKSTKTKSAADDKNGDKAFSPKNTATAGGADVTDDIIDHTDFNDVSTKKLPASAKSAHKSAVQSAAKITHADLKDSKDAGTVEVAIKSKTVKRLVEADYVDGTQDKAGHPEQMPIHRVQAKNLQVKPDLLQPVETVIVADEGRLINQELKKQEKISGVIAPERQLLKEAFTILPRHLDFAPKNATNLSPSERATRAVSMPALRSRRSIKPSLSLTPFVMPEKADLSVSEGRKEHHEDDKDLIEHGETVKAASSYGVQVNLNLSSKLSLISGIGVSASTSTILPRSIYARPHRDGPGQPTTSENNYKINCASGYAYLTTKTGAALPANGDSIQGLTSASRMRHLVVPLGVRYMVGVGKFGIGGMAGLNLNLLSSANLDVNYTEPAGQKEQATVKIEGVKKMYLSAFVGISLEYDISKRFSLQLSPMRSMGVGTINQNTPASSKKTSTGGQLGLRIKL